MTSPQKPPVAAVASLAFIATSVVLLVSFRRAYSLRQFVSAEGTAQFDSLLGVLAIELVFGGLALLVAIWAVVRREGLMSVIAVALAVVNLLARAALM